MRTTNKLLKLVGMAFFMARDAGEAPPITARQFVLLVTKFNARDVMDDYNITADSDKILDSWGNPVIFIAYDGHLAALGSAGPNARWEHGRGDDIFVTLDREVWIDGRRRAEDK